MSDLPHPSARLTANILTTGRGGGHDLHLRTLRDAGVNLLGHFLGADEGRARFANDLAETVVANLSPPRVEEEPELEEETELVGDE